MIEAVVRRCSVKKVHIKISQNSQKNTCARVSFLIKLQASILLKKRLWHRCCPLNSEKILRTPFFIEHLRWPQVYWFFFFNMLLETILQKTTPEMYINYTVINRFAIRKKYCCSFNFSLVKVSGPEIFPLTK